MSGDEKGDKITWKPAIVKLSQLTAWEHNPKTISKAHAQRLLKNWEQLGQWQTIAIDAGFTIADGHQRLNVLKAAYGAEYEIKVLQASRNLTDAERKRIVIEGHAGAVGTWDWDALSSWQPAELNEFGFDVDLLKDWKRDIAGLDTFIKSEQTDPIDAEPQIDRAAELNEKWKVKTGDLWRLGDHRLLCGDSTKREDVERVMGGEKATIMFTDPPYGIDIGKKNRLLNSFQKAGMNLTDIESDSASTEDLGEMLLSAFKLAHEQLTDDASVFVCSPQGGSLGMMMMMMKNAGLEVRHVLNWVKNSPTFSLGRLDYEYQHEPILFTWNKTHKRYKRGFTTSLWAADKPRHSADHPTMKPVELPTNAIINHTDEEDVCYDPFCGSGTTIIACQNLSRKCRAIEISPNYCAVILERMATAFPDIEIELIE